MTIDEAIKLHKKEATILTNGENHQIAEWLEELKVLRKIIHIDESYQQDRNDAIDEFCHWYFDMKNDAQINAVDELIKRFNSEQLKEQENE